MSKKIIIVGGVAGGASAAARLRRIDEQSEIILLEKGEYISFANCGLPYYVGGAIEEREMLFLVTPEKMQKRFNIDVRVLNEVVSIDGKNKTVKIKNHKTNEEYEETFDDLVLSPGSTPLKPPIQGVNEVDNIFSLWTVPDVDIIKSYVEQKEPKKAVVVGGGFIGLEMAENLHDQGLKVSVVEMADQVMTNLDKDMAMLVHNHILSKGVHLYLGDGVESFSKIDNETTQITLQSGKTLEADIIILSIGVRPNTDFIKNSGIKLNQRGGIIVNEYMETSVPHIYAVGDAIQVKDFIDKSDTMIPLAGPANKQGRIVANNIAGKKEKYNGTQGTSVVKVFDMTVATTGNNVKTLDKKQIEYKVAITDSKSHAGYYPGALPMNIKLIFDPSGKILGSQIVGYDGVDKRIDVIATALRFEKTVYDLQELELAYAPPFGSAKDPVNMVGYVASNILKGDVVPAYYEELKNLDSQKTVILDIREGIERELGYIPNSIHVPLDELRERLDEIPKDKEIITYCQIGLRAYLACRILTQNGFKNVRDLMGGFKFYKTIECAKEELANQDDDFGDGSMMYRDFCRQQTYNTESGDVEPSSIPHVGETIKLNACGLSCPGPIMQVYQKMEQLKKGDVLEVSVTDPGFSNDIKIWSEKTGNQLLSVEKVDNTFVAKIKKGTGKELVLTKMGGLPMGSERKTLVVFSGDLDKAIASFIIANGAAAMGKKVTMFFTFWGLNILRKDESVAVSKDPMSKMFGAMMPRGSAKLGLSKMNMMGMGSKMIRGIMNKKKISSLEELMQQAQANGVKLMACQMSMDVMGIKQEELIDKVDIGGVATYLGEAEESNLNLFI